MKIRLIVALILAALLSGCMVGPKYVRPTRFPRRRDSRKRLRTASRKRGNGKFAAARRALASRRNGGRSFGDSQLTALERAGGCGKIKNLKIAEARFRQARALIRVSRASEFPTIATNPSIASLRDSQNQPYFPLHKSTSTGQVRSSFRPLL